MTKTIARLLALVLGATFAVGSCASAGATDATATDRCALFTHANIVAACTQAQTYTENTSHSQGTCRTVDWRRTGYRDRESLLGPSPVECWRFVVNTVTGYHKATGFLPAPS